MGFTLRWINCFINSDYFQRADCDGRWNPHAQFGSGSGLAWMFIVARILGSTLVVPPLEEIFIARLLIATWPTRILKPCHSGDFIGAPFSSLRSVSVLPITNGWREYLRLCVSRIGHLEETSRRRHDRPRHHQSSARPLDRLERRLEILVSALAVLPQRLFALATGFCCASSSCL